MSTVDPEAERTRAHAANMLRDWVCHDHVARPTRGQLREWLSVLLDERSWLYLELSRLHLKVRDLEQDAPAHDEVRAALRLRLRQLISQRDALHQQNKRLRAELATWEDEPVLSAEAVEAIGRATCAHLYRGTMGSAQ